MELCIVCYHLPKAKGNMYFSFFVNAYSISGRHTINNRGCWWGEEMRGRGGRRGQSYPCMAFWTLVSFEASEFYLFKEWNTDTNIQQSKSTLCGACTGAWRLIKMWMWEKTWAMTLNLHLKWLGRRWQLCWLRCEWGVGVRVTQGMLCFRGPRGCPQNHVRQL